MANSTKDDLRQARIGLTTVLCWADRIGLGEGICNDFNLLVPVTTDRCLLNALGTTLVGNQEKWPDHCWFG